MTMALSISRFVLTAATALAVLTTCVLEAGAASTRFDAPLRVQKTPYSSSIEDPGAPFPTLAVADFDVDGVLDVAAAAGWESLGIFRGRGDGSFDPPRGLHLMRAWMCPVAADFDRDGYVDLAVSGGGGAHVVFGDGAGGFSTPLRWDTSETWGIVAADFDGDERPDWATVWRNAGIPELRVFLSRAGRTFAVVSTPFESQFESVYGEELIASDLDLDGDLDLVVQIGSGPAPCRVLLGVGDGRFVLGERYVSHYTADGCEVADFTSDGIPDLVLHGVLGIGLLPGLGDGRFGPQTIVGPHGTWDSRACDLDGDGVLDLLATGDRLAWLRGRGDGTFDAPVTTFTGRAIVPLHVADLDGDERLDAFGSLMDEKGIGSTLGRGDGRFGNAVFELHPFSHAVAAGDFDADGRSDLVSIDAAPLRSWLSRPWGFEPRVADPFSMAWRYPVSPMSAGSIGADNHPALAIASAATRVTLLHAEDDGAFGDPVERHFANTVGGVDLGDVTGDGIGDLVVGTGPGVDVFPGRPDGSLDPPVRSAGLPRSVTRVAVGPLDDDGHADVVVAMGDVVYRGRGGADGIFTFEAFDGTGHPALRPAIADVNLDGRADVVLAPEGPLNMLFVRLRLPGGGFGPTIASIMPQFGESDPCVGDVDGDDVPDVVLASQFDGGGFVIAHGRGDGWFEVRDGWLSDSFVRSAAIGDYDGNGRLDVALNGTRGVRIFLARDAVQPRPTLTHPAPGAALVIGGTVPIEWTVDSDVVSVDLYVSDRANGPWIPMTLGWTGASYAWSVEGTVGDSVWLKLVARDHDGNAGWVRSTAAHVLTQTTDVAGHGAARLAIHGVRPLPVRHGAQIELEAHAPGVATLRLVDVEGRDAGPVRSMALATGRQRVRWAAAGVPAGVYWLQLEHLGVVTAKRIVVLR